MVRSVADRTFQPWSERGSEPAGAGGAEPAPQLGLGLEDRKPAADPALEAPALQAPALQEEDAADDATTEPKDDHSPAEESEDTEAPEAVSRRVQKYGWRATVSIEFFRTGFCLRELIRKLWHLRK